MVGRRRILGQFLRLTCEKRVKYLKWVGFNYLQSDQLTIFEPHKAGSNELVMDADFTQDSVLHFLQSKGGSVKNAELLHHFKGFLREHADQVRNRELFKMFVNCVATVKQDHGVSHVVLRKKFRVPAPIVGGAAIFGTSDRGSAEPPPPKSTLNPAWSRDKLRQKAALPEATMPNLPRESDVKIVLPAAGIMLNNNNNVETNLNRRPKALPVLTHATILDQTRPEYPIPRQIHAQAGQQKVSDQPREISQQVPPSRSPKGPQEPLGGLDMKPKHSSLAVVQPRRVRHRQSYKTAVSYDEDEDEDEEPNLKLAAGPPGSHQGPPNASSSTEIPTIHVHDMANAGRLLHSRPGWSPESVFQPRAGQDALPECPPGGSVPTRRSLPAPLPERTEDEDRRYSQPVGVALANRKVWSATEKTWMSGSHDSILTSPSDAGFPGSDWPAGRHGSTEMQDLTAGASMDALKTLEVPQRPPDPRLAALWHHSTGTLPDKRASAHVAPLHKSSDHLNRQLVLDETQWRHSSGNLYDDHESSDCSASSPARRLSPTRAWRVGGGKLSGRMCRSMGADLDRLLREEAEEGARGNEAARRKRLHRISSSLSLHYNLSSSSLSSCNSLADLAEAHADAKGKRVPLVTGAHHESPNKESQVPLDGREHEWLVKGASGAWPDIYSLFREDATLLHRRDFISGFTVLHWIAKHGDHRVLNTLWYGVQKAGLALDINAKASCGQTPLHIAAVHGHKNMIRLLVNKFNADVELRDTAGKKPWQYLNTSESQEVFHLLGAPARGAAGVPSRSPAAEGHAEEKPRQRRRHRRHHLSFASRGEKPKIVSGSKVKRSSSIAAFLKQNPLSRFHGYKSDG